MEADNDRLSPPFWRHDAYSLRRLRTSIEYQLDNVNVTGFDNARHISAPPITGVAIDIGAGHAPYRPLFEARNIQYTACDIDAVGSDHFGGSINIIPGQPIALTSASADWVVSFQVLEHVWDLDWYLGEVKRLLKPGGRVLLSTHGTWLYHPHPTDYRRWTRDGLIKELEVRGLKVVSVRADVGPLAWTTQFRTLAYHHVLGKIPLIGSLLSALVCGFMYLRMLIEDAVTPVALRENNAAIYTMLAIHDGPKNEPQDQQ